MSATEEAIEVVAAGLAMGYVTHDGEVHYRTDWMAKPTWPALFCKEDSRARVALDSLHAAGYSVVKLEETSEVVEEVPGRDLFPLYRVVAGEVAS